MSAKIWQKGHTWGNRGYDTAYIVNQMTVGSWIGFNSMTSRFILQPIPAIYYIYMICCCTYKFDEVCMCSPFFSSKIYRKIWSVLTCCEALACLIFQTNPWIGWKVIALKCYEIYLNLLTSFWYEFFHLSSCKSLIGAGKCPSCRCRMWDAKSRVVGVFHDICGQIPSRLVLSCHLVSWIL